MVRIGGDIGGIELEAGDTIAVNGNDWVYQSDGTLEGPALSTDRVYTASRAADAVVWTDGTTYYADGAGGGVSSGSDADVVLQAVLDDLASADNRDNATVFVSAGVYPIDTTVTVREGITLNLSEGAYIVPTADVNALSVLPDGQIHGGVIDCRDNGAVTDYSSSAVYIEGTESGGVNFDGRTDTRVQDTFIKLADGSGRAVELNAPPQSDMHVTWVTVSGISIFRGADAIYLTARNPANGQTWVNSNKIENITIYQSNNGIVSNPTSGNEIAGNTFENIAMQPNGNSVRFVDFTGPSRYNQFDNMFYWDWATASSSTAISFNSDTMGNTYDGNIYFADLNDAGQNAVNGQSTVGTSPGSSAKWQGAESLAYNLGVTIWDTSTSPSTAYFAGPDQTFQTI